MLQQVPPVRDNVDDYQPNDGAEQAAHNRTVLNRFNHVGLFASVK